MRKSAIILAALLTARPTLAAEQCLEVNSIGLLLTIVGAGLVFRYGMSFQVRTGGWPQWVDDNPPDQDQMSWSGVMIDWPCLALSMSCLAPSIRSPLTGSSIGVG